MVVVMPRSLLGVVANGHPLARGRATAERFAAARHGGRTGLRVFALPLPAVPLRLAWHPRQQADPAHRWLRETLLAMMKDRA